MNFRTLLCVATFGVLLQFAQGCRNSEETTESPSQSLQGNLQRGLSEEEAARLSGSGQGGGGAAFPGD